MDLIRWQIALSEHSTSELHLFHSEVVHEKAKGIFFLYPCIIFYQVV